MNSINIKEYGGALYNDLYFCERRVWFMYHKILPDKSNLDIIEGNIQQKEFNPEDEFRIGNISIDKISNGILYEHKKSIYSIKGALAQIRNYLYILNKLYNIPINKGVLIVGKDNKDIYEVLYNKDMELLFISDYNVIDNLINSTIPSKNKDKKMCLKCSYFEKCNI